MEKFNRAPRLWSKYHYIISIQNSIRSYWALKCRLFCISVSRKILNLRGHPYKLIHDVTKKSVRNTFVNRIVGIWNNLHLDARIFSSFKQFKQSLTTDILAPFCKVNFN